MTTLPLVAPEEVRIPVLRVSDLRQWTYCPRVVWWTHVCPVGKVESFKMRQGRAKEERLQQLQKRRTLRAFAMADGTVECNVDLFSERVGLSGRLDMIIRRGPCRFPVEIKFTQGPARLNHRLQLAGYALLLEELFGVQISHGFVVRLPDETVDMIEIDVPLRELTRKTMQALRDMIRREEMPPANRVVARCTDCEYLRFCGDVIPQ